MSAVLILMAAFFSCDENKGSGGSTDGNSFVGTWFSEDDGKILEVTETVWTVKYKNTTILRGDYTHKGSSANLTVTYVVDGYVIGLTVGDEGAAKVSGRKVTVTFDGLEKMVFAKESGGGGDNGGTFVIEAKNVIGGNSDIATAAGLIESAATDAYEIASAPYKNSGFKLKVPATVANKHLWTMGEWFDGDLFNIISDKNAKVTFLWLEAKDRDDDYIGEFYLEDERNNYYAAVTYMYVDRNFTIKGTTHYGNDATKWNCTLKKGWNIIYYVEDSKGGESISTTKPSGVNLKWYFYDGYDWKTPPTSPKHKKAGFEKFRAVK